MVGLQRICFRAEWSSEGNLNAEKQVWAPEYVISVTKSGISDGMH